MKQQAKQELLQDITSKKVLITGVDGFTGIHLEKLLLNKGYEVFGTVTKNPKDKKHFVCDIKNIEEIREVLEFIKPDYIFHLAGISFVGTQNRSLMYDVNVLGTENLLSALDDSKLIPEKIVIASSATVYGNQNSSVLEESMCPKPVNHYGCSKLIMEHIVAGYFQKFNIIITRPFNYTGPNQPDHFLIPKIIKHYKEKKEYIELGNINVAREFNNVSDVSNIYYQLMLCKTNSVIVNVCSGVGVYLTDIINYMNTLAGYKIKIKVNPDLVRANEIIELKGSTEKLSSLISFVTKEDIQKTLNQMYLLP